MMKYGEAKAIVSLYAIGILGIGVFTPEYTNKRRKK